MEEQTISARRSDWELREQIGQLFAVGFHGYRPSPEIKTLIQTHHIGAIVLFQRNISSACQLSNLTRTLQKLAKDSGHTKPLIIAIDQENGSTTRIKPPIASQLPGSMAIAANRSMEIGVSIAEATGEMLDYFGINMNYAPVADINSNPANPVIGVRSFSDDASIVSAFVSASIQGLRNRGIIPCVKHFPGHGDTAVDSHRGLPVIDKLRDQLDECELVPFKRAVEEGVQAVMTAHISLPGLGDNMPASLNPNVIKILRDEWSYDGIIISDCLEMDGVRLKYGTEGSAVLALKAGSDSVMICHTYNAQVAALNRVHSAVKSESLSRDQIAASFARISKLKEKLCWPVGLDSDEIPERDPKVLEEMNSRHAKIASTAYAKSVTVVRSEPGLLPIISTWLSSKNKIAILYPEIPVKRSAVRWIDKQVWNKAIESLDFLAGTDVHWFPYYEESTYETEWLLDLDPSTVLFLTRNAHLHDWQVELADEIWDSDGAGAAGFNFIVISTCDPYDFLEDEVFENLVAMYDPTAEAFRAAVELIFNASPERKEGGSLPLSISSVAHNKLKRKRESA